MAWDETRWQMNHVLLSFCFQMLEAAFLREVATALLRNPKAPVAGLQMTMKDAADAGDDLFNHAAIGFKDTHSEVLVNH